MSQARRNMKMKRKYFNMIEVVLALGVIALGVVGIMGILPVAINSSKAAVGDSYAADVANTFFSHIETALKAEGNWATELTDIPIEPTQLNADNTEWNFTEDSGIERKSPGLYKIRLTQGANTTFTAHARVWRENLPNLSVAKQSLPSPPDERYAIRVYVEISWPHTADYDNREKRIYAREIFNPNP